MLRKLIVRIIKFSVLFVAIYIVVVLLWGTYAPNGLKLNIRQPNSGYLKEKAQDIKKYKDLDILFIGASNVYRGIDPRVFREAGYNVFNLGSNSQTPDLSLLLLKNYLEELNPKMVIMDVYPSNFEKDGVESGLDVLTNLPLNRYSVWYALKTFNIKLLNSLVYNGFFQLTPFGNPYGELHPKQPGSKYVSGGYAEYEATSNHYIHKFPQNTWSLLEDQKKALAEIGQYLQKKETKLLLIRIPLASYKYKAFQNNAAVDSLFSKTAEFYNFQDRVQLSDSLDFLDGTHMSRRGGEKFTSALLDFIQQKLEKRIK